MEVDSNGVCLVSSVAEYAKRYSGYTQLRRLLHVAVSSEQHREEAVRLMISALKQGINTSLYEQLYRDVPGAVSVEPMDRSWMNSTDRAAASTMETLEQELNSARSLISKEGLRKANSNIGDFYYARGSLQEAMKYYYCCRDYCSTTWQLEEMFDSVFNVSADQDEFAMVGVSLKSVDSSASRPFGAERRQLSTAVIALRQKDYAAAAKAFVGLQNFSESLFPTLISSQDISVYGALLSVATLSRSELRSIASAGHPFKQYLELVPCMEKFLIDFLECRYLSVMEICNNLAEQFQYDIILKNHLKSILAMITDNVFLQSIAPYETVDLVKIAGGLRMSADDVVARLAGLIADGRVQARLDTVSMTLHRIKLNQQEIAVKKIIELTSEHAINSQRALLRLSLLQATAAAAPASGGGGASGKSQSYIDYDM